jgi:hypothetical protein
MLYRPVKLSKIVEVQYRKLKPGENLSGIIVRNDGIPTTTRSNGEQYVLSGVERTYWRVHSNMFGECGHKHKTEASAQVCFNRFKKRWHAARSAQQKTLARKRKQGERYVVTLNKVAGIPNIEVKKLK